MRRRAFAVVALVVLAACRDGGADEPQTTVPTAPSVTEPSTTPTTVVSYEVPAIIDTAYIGRVMAALDHVDGEAARRAASQRRLDEEFFKYYVSIYTDRYFKLVQQAWYEIAGNNFELLSQSPRNPATEVVRLIDASPSCVFFEVRRNFSEVFTIPDPPSRPRFVALVPLRPDRNGEGYNPTPWIMNFDGNFESGNEPKPEDACAGS